MRLKMKLLAGLIVTILLLCPDAHSAPSLSDYCSDQYIKNGVCPDELCSLSCLGSKNPMTLEDCQAEANKLYFCSARRCDEFSKNKCPKPYCQLMTNCSKEQICQDAIPADQIPPCGGLAYNGQDAKCCDGYVKRCGFDYLDGSCNMEGKNSPYHLPICIPCGDGKCTNFENHCNCPEDCPKNLIPLS